MHMDILWTKIKEMIDDKGKLPIPKPNYFESFHKHDYPEEAQNALGAFIAPSGQPIAIPSLCVEFKSPYYGTAYNALTHAAYDGAMMILASWKIHNYLNKPAADFFGRTKALVIAVTDTVEVYACHALPVDRLSQKQLLDSRFIYPRYQ